MIKTIVSALSFSRLELYLSSKCVYGCDDGMSAVWDERSAVLKIFRRKKEREGEKENMHI